jgi:hypothetical protein
MSKQRSWQELKRVDEAIIHWQQVLGLADYTITAEHISLFQVSDNYCAVGYSLVGVESDHRKKKACIYYTRRLTEEDIVHELLHVRYPLWTEEQVNIATGKFCQAKYKMPGILTLVKNQKFAPSNY